MIPLPGWCRTLHLVTLGLSMLCLIVVEDAFMPNASAYLFLLFGMVAAAWFTEGRWMLPNWASNILALAVAGLSGLWLWRNLTSSGSLFQHVAFPAVIVPYAGLVLLFLMIVMLFRSRGRPDFWRLQGLGFVQVAVACTLAGPPIFGAVLLAYFAAGLTTLAAHYRVVNTGSAAPPGWSLPWSSTRWLLAVTAPALALALLTPRGEGFIWDPYGQFGGRSAPVTNVGYDEEIDLAATGEIELNEVLAFAVDAVDANGLPKEDLTLEQRWRGGVLDVYENGKWRSHYRGQNLRLSGAHLADHLPDLGPDKFFLSFRVQPQKAGGLFVAEPVLVGRAPVLLPILTKSAGPRREHLFTYIAGTIFPLPVDPRNEYQYQQVVAPSPTPDRTPVRFMPPTYLSRLKNHHLPELEKWTSDLVRRLVAEGRYGLKAADLSILSKADKTAEPVPPRGEQVARALSDYLAQSREYTYTLDRRRQDTDVDPAVDFLCNTKEGHCERFATGLALMLRTLGIPARLVKGFRGVEHQGQGKYFIRQRFAHAWVEVLVAHADDDSGYYYDWMSLDPTASGTTTTQARLSTWAWLLDRIRNSDQLWRDLIVDLRADQQIELWSALAPVLLVLGLLGLVAAGVVRFVRLWTRRPAGPRQTMPLYARMVKLIGRYGGPQPSSSQTPREYSLAAADFLRPTLAAELADVPVEAVVLLYRQRYGGLQATPEENLTLTARIDELGVRLRRDVANRDLNGGSEPEA